MSEFLSRESVYRGNYTFFKRDPDTEYNRSLHYHDFYEVQIYTQGKGTLTMCGVDYPVSRGDIVLIKLFEPHQFRYDPEGGHIRYCLSLDPSFLLSVCSESSNFLSIFNSNNHNYPVIRLSEDRFQPYLSVISRFESISLQHGRDIMERALLFELLAYLYDHYFDGSQSSPADTGNMEVISKLVRFVNDHVSEELPLRRLSEVANFSEFHMCRMFKKYTGYTLNRYILSKRIEKAKVLLRGSLPIAEISRQAGFHNYSCFYKTFKRICRVGPAEYRVLNADSGEKTEGN